LKRVSKSAIYIAVSAGDFIVYEIVYEVINQKKRCQENFHCHISLENI